MQTPHPLELWILKRRVVRKAQLDAFLEDGVLTAKERYALDVLAAEDEAVIEYRAREVAADSFKRNGATRLTRDRFHDAGFVINLDQERHRRASNIVPLRREQDAG